MLIEQIKAQKHYCCIGSVSGGRFPIMVSLAIGSITALLFVTHSSASAEPQSVNVQFANKTFQLTYNMSNGGSIESASAESQQPYGGSLYMIITSPARGFLEVTMPRELFDLVGFTDHFDNFGGGFELSAFDSGGVLPIQVTNLNCDKITLRIPIQARSEEVWIVTTDVLQVHGHPYPPALHVMEKVVVDESKYNVHMWTDAIKCDVSFSKAEKKLHIDIEGRNETSGGDFSIAIPPQLLGGNYTVLVDGKRVDFTKQRSYTDDSSDNFVLNRLGLDYPAGAKTIDVISTSLLDAKSAFKAFALPNPVHDLIHIIEGKTQTGIRVVNSTIMPDVGIYIDLNTTTGGIMEVNLPKTVIEDVQLVEVSHSDVQEPISFEIVEDDVYRTVIQFSVIDGAQQVAIKGAGGIVPEFGSIAALIMAVSLVAIISWNFVRKRFGFV